MTRTTISTRADQTQLCVMGEASEYVSDNELTKLFSYATGDKAYKVRTNSHGRSLACQVGSCDNLAMLDARKQLCPVHYAPFLRRSNAEKAKPKRSKCNVHTSHTYQGKPQCMGCMEAQKALHDLQARWLDHGERKQRQLANAETVHDLREWIKEYLA